MQRFNIRPTDEQLEGVKKHKLPTRTENLKNFSPADLARFKTIAKATKYCKCGKKALYKVGKVGYCKDHQAEARKILVNGKY